MNVLKEVIIVIPMPHAIIQRVALHVLATQATAATESFVKVYRICEFIIDCIIEPILIQAMHNFCIPQLELVSTTTTTTESTTKETTIATTTTTTERTGNF